MSAVYLITGVSAAGKSTVARLLAERFDRAAAISGDAYRRMIVRGRVDMTPDAGEEALAQLGLRYRLAAMVANEYAAAGFTAVLQDIALGPMLRGWVDAVTCRPRYLIVLAPRPEVIHARNAARGKDGYHAFAVEQLDAVLRQDTPRIGLWLDTSALTPEETVVAILARAPEAAV